MAALRRFAPGESLTAGRLNALVDAVNANRLNSGPGFKLTRTPSGTTLSAKGGARAPGGGGVSAADFPWRVAAATNTVDGEPDGTFRITMSPGRLLVAAAVAYAPGGNSWAPGFPAPVRQVAAPAPRGVVEAAAGESGFVVLRVSGSFALTSQNRFGWSVQAPVVEFAPGGNVAESATLFNIPVARVEISDGAATVAQYVAWTLPLSLPAPLARMSSVRRIDYDGETGDLTQSLAPGVAFAGESGEPESETVFTAVDEEI